MLAYKILACEVCVTWWMPTEALRNSLPIAESRTGKPAMVTLKTQLDCSKLHDTTLWANIYVRSHAGCGTDSVFNPFLQGSQIFQRRKSDANKQDFENKLNLTCQAQATPQNKRDYNQGILHIWSKFGGPSLNGWWVIARTNSKWGKFWFLRLVWPWS